MDEHAVNVNGASNHGLSAQHEYMKAETKRIFSFANMRRERLMQEANRINCASCRTIAIEAIG